MRLNTGYVNSGSFFTQSLYKIFAAKLKRNMIVYVDDVFIMHRNDDEHGWLRGFREPRPQSEVWPHCLLPPNKIF